MGKVLDVYWHFAEPGDNYLGRIMAGLDSLLPTFRVLPPHFNLEDPMGNEDIAEAMDLMYGPILNVWANTAQDPSGLLLRLLASIVHHFDWVQKMARTSTKHPFNAIPLIFKPELVKELKALITIEPSIVIEKPTGIPPHVEHISKIQHVLTVANECLQLLKNQVVDIKQVRNYVSLFLFLN